MGEKIIFGFTTIGKIEQTGVSPLAESKKPPPGLSGIWKGNLQRFQTRARASGLLNAAPLWGDALAQVSRGWHAPPTPYDLIGNIPAWGVVGTIADLRFGVDQVDKIRACDDLKYSTNQYCYVKTPIKLPTWDHIGQLALDVQKTNRPWSFVKTDHEAAYKQPPLDREHAKLAMVTLRHPTSGTWYAFRPHSLLFGAEAAVTHYNCFSRTIVILINRIFGIPILAYFDDCGALSPLTLTN